MRSGRALRGITAIAAAVSSFAVFTGSADAVTVPSPPDPGPGEVVEAFEKNPFFTAEFGLENPAAVTYVDGQGALAIAEPRSGGSIVALLKPEREDVVGRMVVPGLSDPTTLADDGKGTLAAFDGQTLLTWPAAARGTASVRKLTVEGETVEDPAGMTYDESSSQWLVLDAARQQVVALDQRGSQVVATKGLSLSGLGANSLKGLAFEDSTGLTYVADPEASRLYAVSPEGEPADTYDLGDIDAASLTSLSFGATADPTDSRVLSSLYTTQSGDASTFGQVSELSLQPLEAAAAAAPLESTGTLVRRTLLSQLSPPSPDPSGIVYMSDVDRLLVADSEVEEMAIYQGVNLWQISRNGSTLHETGNTLAYSMEPTGVGYDPAGKRMFVSDDGRRRIFEVTRGPDNRFGTADDPMTWFSTRGFANEDPEDVTYDTRSGDLFVTDGVGLDVVRVSAGPNGRFDGVAPDGDDVATRYDVGAYGITDLEGIGYSPTRDSLFLADRKYTKILEVTKDGGLVQSIDVAGINMNNPAAITLAPGSNDPTRTNLYVTTRGVDNDNNPNENDGMMFEISAPTLGPGDPQDNQAPTVSAGGDQSVVLPGSASLDGTVSDDGLPNPPGAVSTTWSRVSGPGTVTFGNASATDTTASFSTAGTYVLRLTASDGALTAVDEVTVTASAAPGGGTTQTVEVRVAAGSDDAEQRGSSSTDLTSTDLELVVDNTTQQVVGTRFAGLQVPAGATVTSAWVQFRTDEVSTGASSLTIRAEAADNTPTYQAVAGNLTARATTTASVAWSPPAWNTVGETAAAQRTPDIAALVQAVVSRPGWASGNALALQFSGSGRRTAESFEGGATFAPLLHVEYTTGGGGTPTNQAPVVNAGSDQTIVLPGSASLDGTVSDDGLPNPPGAVSTTWSRVSGPGTVTFGNAAAVDTTASFSAAGTYELRLSAYDGALTTEDEVVVTVSSGGGGGGSLPGQIDGIEIESHDHIAPVMDANGNLYRVTEDTLANGNRPRVMKSSDGGVTWSEQDAANRPTTGDTEGGWLLQDGPNLWFAWQKSATVHLTRFRTSDHPTNPDTYDIQIETVATPSDPGPQYASLAKNSDGSLWVAYGASPAGGPRSAVVKRLPGGGYGAPTILDTGTATTAPRLVKGSGDLTHVLYKDHSNNRIYWRTLSTAGVLSAPVRVDSGGTHAVETPITNAVAYSDGGVQVVMVAFADPSGILKSVEIRDGVVGPEQTISSGSVTINPATTTNLAAVAHLAVAGSTVVAMWSDAANGHVYRDQRPVGGTWGADTLTVDTGAGTGSLVQYVYNSVLEQSGSEARIGFTYDVGPHADDDSNIFYDEVTVETGSGGGGPVNQAPSVSAGADQSVVLPSSASLDGTVSDDGLPNPPGATTVLWSRVSGPGAVTFANAAAVDTTASFSAAGAYVLRLTADDGALTAADEVTVTVSSGGGGGGTTQTVEVRVAASSDDAEQRLSGSTDLTSTDLELTTDKSTQQVVGMRFPGLAIPAGATITNAYVQFTVDEVSTGAVSLTIRGEAADNAPTYLGTSGNVTSRATTAANVSWVPPDWNTRGQAAAGQRTPNLAAVVQAVVGRAGWSSGNALALQISGTGRRTAEAFDGVASAAPLLHVEYTTGSGGGGPVNQAPTVSAGADQSVVLPSSASLDGTVNDDGLPNPPGATTVTWSKVSGPGTVTFGNAAAVDTTASFSEAGSYVLRLSADDGALTTADEVVVTVSPASGGGGGTTQTLEVRVATSSDDAEQRLSGSMDLTSSDLELTTDNSTQQVVGMRFPGLAIPAGATITNAYVQFTVDEVSTGAVSLTIRGEAADNAPTYVGTSGSMVSRATTAANVAWAPPDWNTRGQAAAGQRTPNLAAVVQAVVGRAGWASGNALALQISGTGRRTAESYDGVPSAAPLLHIEYTIG
ncbi:MAG TPA: hypothetical protein VLB29_06750 [Nocardioidaceae bacterium]|nr:hypothetical protein [Nocardioidaceae bacterium]